MKISKTVLGSALVVLILSGIFFFGCSNKTSDITASRDMHPVPAYEGPEGRMYTASDAATASQLSEVSKHGYLKGPFAKLNSMGLVLRPEFGYVMEGSGTNAAGTETLSVRISTLAFGQSDGGLDQAGYVNVIECEKGTRISIYVVKFSPSTDPDFEVLVSDRIWVKYFDDVTVEKNRSGSEYSTGWDWKSWGRCTVKGTLAGCAGGMAGCIYAGPEWAECTAVTCAGATVTSGIGCALDQWFS